MERGLLRAHWKGKLMQMRRLGLWFFIMAAFGFGLTFLDLGLVRTLIIAGVASFSGGVYLSATGRV